MLEKSRVQDLVESKKQQFAAARGAFAQAPAVQAQEQNCPKREHISLKDLDLVEALDLNLPKRQAGQNPPRQNLHLQQNQHQQQAPQNPNLQRVPQNPQQLHPNGVLRRRGSF